MKRFPSKFTYASLLGFVLSGGIARAQTAALPATPVKTPAVPVLSEGDRTAKLQQKVHLLLGPTTLTALTQEIAKQAGVVVSAEDSLQERQLIVMLDNVSLADALNALAELNYWGWQQNDTGAIQLSRLPAQPPLVADDAPRLMQAALPRDLQTFLGGSRPGVPAEAVVQLGGMSVRMARIYPCFGAARNRLRELLDVKTLAANPLPYAETSAEQRETFHLSLLMQTLLSSNTDLFQGGSFHFATDPAKTTLSYNKRENTILCNTEFSLGNLVRDLEFSTAAKPKIRGQRK